MVNEINLVDSVLGFGFWWPRWVYVWVSVVMVGFNRGSGFRFGFQRRWWVWPNMVSMGLPLLIARLALILV